jgi:hypothetical protein
MKTNVVIENESDEWQVTIKLIAGKCKSPIIHK